MLNRIIQEDINSIVKHNLPWDELKKSTILISGANGLLPFYMVEVLLFLNDYYQKDIKVIALVRNKKKALQKFIHHKGRKDLEFMFQDVCEPIKIKEPVDYIIHAASQASPRYYGKDPVGTLNANTLGTINLFKMVQKKSLKVFLFFSSSEVYGEVQANQIPTKEEDFGYIDPMNIRSCYGESKRMGENICCSWFHQFNIPVKIVRPFHTYGPGMDLNDGRVFADFVSDVINNRDIILKSDGSAKRAFCYLADATLGFFTVLLKGKNGEAYNVGNNREISMLELAKMLINLFPEKKLKIIINAPQNNVGYIKSILDRVCPNINKINNLGWFPVTKIKDGFYKTIISYE